MENTENNNKETARSPGLPSLQPLPLTHFTEANPEVVSGGSGQQTPSLEQCLTKSLEAFKNAMINKLDEFSNRLGREKDPRAKAKGKRLTVDTDDERKSSETSSNSEPESDNERVSQKRKKIKLKKAETSRAKAEKRGGKV